MTDQDTRTRALSFYPCRRGFAYAVVEDGLFLVDWGMAELRVDDDTEFCRRCERLTARFEPGVVVVEDCSASRRSEKARTRIELVVSLANLLDLRISLVSPAELRKSLNLGPMATKNDIVEQVIVLFPELTRKRPRRRIWQRDRRTHLFDAVALAASSYRAT